VSSAKCLDCHQEIASRVKENHGLHPQYVAADKQCFDCHVEHRGVDVSLVVWESGRDNFDHKQTHFELLGKHKEQTCVKCHEPRFTHQSIVTKDGLKRSGQTYLGLSSECTSCHADYHRKQITRGCKECHSESNWKEPINFDHARSKYPLTGKHSSVECNKCHLPMTGEKQTGLGAETTLYFKYTGFNFETCTGCHTDPHKNALGSECAKCHSTSGWNELASGAFNHDQTKFPLRGKHRAVACAKCHRSGVSSRPEAFSKCSDCHADYHQGQFAQSLKTTECSACHTVEGYLPSLYSQQDHGKSSFPLTGAHLALPCVLCHRKDVKLPSQFRYADKSCISCHSNPHGEQFAKFVQKESGCEGCHQTAQWKAANFDHSKSGFNLDGRHSNLTCAKCHKQQDALGKAIYTGSQKACVSCHEDKHYGQFVNVDGKNPCEHCHSVTGWKQLLFDHGKTRFALTGAHQRVTCEKCHPAELKETDKLVVRYRGVSFACESCHATQSIQR
jgi:hypothetical protein